MPKDRRPKKSLQRRRLSEKIKQTVDLMSEKVERAGFWIYLLGQIALLVAGVVAGGIFSANGLKWTPAVGIWLVVGVIGLAASSLVTWSKNNAGEILKTEAESAKVDVQETLQDVLIPLLGAVQKTATAPNSMRVSRIKNAISLAMQARPFLFDKELEVRMVIYQIRGVKGARTLEVVEHYGRRNNVPKGFDERSPGRGQKVFEWLDSEAGGPPPLWIPDCTKETNPHWQGSANGYSTFISAPIHNGITPLGMVAVDAPVPTALSKLDIPMVEVIARLLGIAFSLKDR